MVEAEEWMFAHTMNLHGTAKSSGRTLGPSQYHLMKLDVSGKETGTFSSPQLSRYQRPGSVISKARRDGLSMRTVQGRRRLLHGTNIELPRGEPAVLEQHGL